MSCVIFDFLIDFPFRCIFVFSCIPNRPFRFPLNRFHGFLKIFSCHRSSRAPSVLFLLFGDADNGCKAEEKKTIISFFCSQLPDVTSLIGNVDDLISEEDIQTISESQQKLENIRKDINDTIHSRIPEVTDSIRRTGGAIKNISHVIDRTFDQISDQTGSVNNHLNTADAYIKEYYIYVYYVLLGISSTLLLVLMCIVCGLLCGICGKRPDGYGDDCCNKGAGARFLIL